MSLKYNNIHSTFMRYMFRPHRAIFRQHIIKESTALRTLSIVLLRYVVIIINFGIIGCSCTIGSFSRRARLHEWVWVIIGCLFFLSFELRPLCAPFGVPLSWSCVSCVDLCSLCTYICIHVYGWWLFHRIRCVRSKGWKVMLSLCLTN
jgi:hypothetical protein